MYLTFEEYVSKWNEIAGTFSHDAVLKGSFDSYAEKGKGKRGTTEVDEAFLQEIERWREDLARNIAERNPSLTQQDLNFAVQRTIDRIVFLRICEDRGVEEYGRLRALTDGPGVYRRLVERFHRADERYNSGLFHFTRERDRSEAHDELTPELKLDDKVLRDILGSIYYPTSPYEFSVLPADILGQVYEQFLGKVIRLTPAHRAKIEEKPEVRKAGGVYYTPSYVVDYIVEIVHATREPAESGLKELGPLIEFGASPRATIALAQASRAHAFLRGRTFVTPDDVKSIAPDVLRHRVLTTYEAEAEEVTSDDVVGKILSTIESP